MATTNRRARAGVLGIALGVALGLGGAGPVQAARIDLVLAVDDTGGMGDDIAVLQALLPGANDLFVDAGHDVAYGLVSFHDTPTVEQDLVGYSVFGAPSGAFQTLTTISVASAENGSLAASAATALGFRPGSLRVVLLFSDEANQATPAETNAAIADLQAVGAELWALLENPSVLGSSYLPLVAGSGAYDPTNSARLFSLNGGLALEDVAYAVSDHATLVPEPGTGTLLGLGAVVLGVAARRREARSTRGAEREA